MIISALTSFLIGEFKEPNFLLLIKTNDQEFLGFRIQDEQMIEGTPRKGLTVNITSQFELFKNFSIGWASFQTTDEDDGWTRTIYFHFSHNMAGDVEIKFAKNFENQHFFRIAIIRDSSPIILSIGGVIRNFLISLYDLKVVMMPVS